MKIAITSALLAWSTIAAAEPAATCEGSATGFTLRVAGAHGIYEATFTDTVGSTTLRDSAGRVIASARATTTGTREVRTTTPWSLSFARAAANELEPVFESAQFQRCTAASEPFHAKWFQYYCPILIFIPDPDLEALLCPPIFGPPID